MVVAERLGDPARAGKAIEQIEVAFVTTRDGGNAPAAAYFQAQLTKARALLDRLSQNGSSGETNKPKAAAARGHP
jgi:hypothetical protein